MANNQRSLSTSTPIGRQACSRSHGMVLRQRKPESEDVLHESPISIPPTDNDNEEDDDNDIQVNTFSTISLTSDNEEDISENIDAEYQSKIHAPHTTTDSYDCSSMEAFRRDQTSIGFSTQSLPLFSPTRGVMKSHSPSYYKKWQSAVQCDSPQSVSVKRILDFAQSENASREGSVQSASHQQTPEEFAQKVMNYFQCSKNVLIGRRMGREHVDIVGKLFTDHDCYPALSIIFSHLHGKDLCSAVSVSKTWRQAVMSDQSARHRQLQHVTHLMSFGQENYHHVVRLERSLSRSRLDDSGTRSPFGQHVVTASPGGSESGGTPRGSPALRHWTSQSNIESAGHPSSERFCWFVKAAGECRQDQSISKCPRCDSPSRVHAVREQGRCLSPRCGHSFCVRCRRPFHRADPCRHLATSAPDLAAPPRRSFEPRPKHSDATRSLRRL